MSQKILVASAALLITRDAMTILPVTVPAYEVEVMKAVHGEENVRVLQDKTDPVPVEAAIEAERMEQRYGPERLEKAFGANFKGAINRAVKEHILEGSVDDDTGEAKALDAMSKAELLAEAEKRGVKADATMNKAAIVEAIETANLG